MNVRRERPHWYSEERRRHQNQLTVCSSLDRQLKLVATTSVTYGRPSRANCRGNDHVSFHAKECIVAKRCQAKTIPPQMSVRKKKTMERSSQEETKYCISQQNELTYLFVSMIFGISASLQWSSKDLLTWCVIYIATLALSRCRTMLTMPKQFCERE